jgi:uncharacterized protein (TIGR03435 family)
MSVVRLSILLNLLGGVLLAQSVAGDAKIWSYDVVSVRPNPSASNDLLTTTPGDAYSGRNVRIVNLLSLAYGMKQDLISGIPGWAEAAHFDVEAKMSPEDAKVFEKLSREARNAAGKAALRRVLEERFHLKVHVEARQLPVYNLVVAKGGLKIKPVMGSNTGWKVVKGPDGTDLPRFQDGMLNDQWIEMSGLAGQLTNLVHHMVIDKTGLTDRFNFVLWFAPDRDAPSGEGSETPNLDAPPIFDALEEQLGLKLQPGKGIVDILVVDHVEHPTDN